MSKTDLVVTNIEIPKGNPTQLQTFIEEMFQDIAKQGKTPLPQFALKMAGTKAALVILESDGEPDWPDVIRRVKKQLPGDIHFGYFGAMLDLMVSTGPGQPMNESNRTPCILAFTKHGVTNVYLAPLKTGSAGQPKKIGAFEETNAPHLQGFDWLKLWF